MCVGLFLACEIILDVWDYFLSGRKVMLGIYVGFICNNIGICVSVSVGLFCVREVIMGMWNYSGGMGLHVG